eukprot:3187956-Lingulodinium_polyedra.AAC.1
MKRARDGVLPWIAMKSFEPIVWRPTLRDEAPPFDLFPTETELQRGYLRFAIFSRSSSRPAWRIWSCSSPGD